MNKQQIKQELRRSACEDTHPWFIESHDSFMAAREFCGCNEFFCTLLEDCRTFFLLVAEAL